MKLSKTAFGFGLLVVLLPKVTVAQIRPDATVGTQVTPNVTINGVLSSSITNGTIRGNNLFHSFSEFNIDSGRGAYFANPADVTNIFTRVTGTNPSNINGTLGVSGNANLFFMNPNGIVFGTAAKLDLKGSFLGTTANSIKFADGLEFTNKGGETPPLLSVTIPIGLGFGSNPGKIQVQGTGHNLTASEPIFSPYTPPPKAFLTTGLQVKPGKTLALVGGEIDLNGGILTALGGRIELGGVGAASQVGLTRNTGGFALDYKDVPTFQNIRLGQQSLINVSADFFSGTSAGSVQVQGNRISINDGSNIWSQNFGNQAADGEFISLILLILTIFSRE
jgi:filamentous hemagglutinin family protein